MFGLRSRLRAPEFRLFGPFWKKEKKWRESGAASHY